MTKFVRALSVVAVMASLCIATTSLQASASPNSVRQGTGGLRTSTRSAGTVMRSVQLGHAHMLIKTTASLAAVSKSTTTKLKTSSRITRAGQTTANTQCLTTDFNGDCPSGNQSVTYNGGALVKNPAVYVVTFSTSSNSLTSTDTSGYVSGLLASGNTGVASSQLQGAINASVSGPWATWWQNEYSTPNYTLGAGHYAGSIIVNNATAANGTSQSYCTSTDVSGNCVTTSTGTVIDDADIQNALAGSSAIAAAAASNNGNAVFVTLFRADQVITYGQTPQSVSPQNSVTAFCGYHSNAGIDSVTSTTPATNLDYVVLPNEGGQSGCQFTSSTGSDFDNFTPILSHELAETQTDPQQACTGTGQNQVCNATGWIAPASGTGYEIGDNCESSPYIVSSMTSAVSGVGGDSNSYYLQDIWSNEAQGCLSAQLTPTIGLAWTSSNVVQATLTAPDATTSGANSLPNAPVVFTLMNGSTVVSTYSTTTSGCTVISNSYSFQRNYSSLATPYYSCTNSGTASWTVPSLSAGETITVSYSGVYPGTTYGLGTGSTESGAFTSATNSISTTTNTQVLSVSQVGSGSVTSNPSGISLGAAGSTNASFANGTSVTLTETPSSGWSFTGWSGACTGSAATCTVSMSQARSVTATFTQVTYQLSVTQVGSGSVSSDVSGISLTTPGTQSHSYNGGTSVTLTESPASNYSFTGWSGACTGSAATCTVSMSQARSVTATFTVVTYNVGVTQMGNGSIRANSTTISSSPGTTTVTFNAGTTVQLSEVPAAGYVFSGWSGACSGQSATCSITINQASNVTANFVISSAIVAQWTSANTLSVDLASGGPLSGATIDVNVGSTTIATGATDGQGIATLSISFMEPAGTTETVSFLGDASHEEASTTVVTPLVGPLVLGAHLSTGQCFFQPSGSDQVCLTQHGDLVELGADGSTMFDALVSGGTSATLTATGNLVVTNASGQILWSSQTAGLGVTKLTILNSGVVALLDNSNQAWWTTNGAAQGLLASAARHLAIPQKAKSLALGQKLNAGSCLFAPSGAAMVCVTGSGNVVVTDASGRIVWNAHTSGKGVSLMLKTNGQLVITNSAGRVLWSAGAANKTTRSMVVSNTGAIHLISATNKILWTSTKGR